MCSQMQGGLDDDLEHLYKFLQFEAKRFEIQSQNLSCVTDFVVCLSFAPWNCSAVAGAEAGLDRNGNAQGAQACI